MVDVKERDEERAEDWLSECIGDYDSSVDYWQRRRASLAAEFAAVRAAALREAAAMCEAYRRQDNTMLESAAGYMRDRILGLLP